MNTKIISFTEYLFWGIISNFYSPITISVIMATKTETSATTTTTAVKTSLKFEFASFQTLSRLFVPTQFVHVGNFS